jgi:hypothetical protein
MHKEDVKIGKKIFIEKAVHKYCCFDNNRVRRRGSHPKRMTGYVVGLRKKLVEWRVEGGGSYNEFGEYSGGQAYVVPVLYDYVIEFKESLASKTREAFLHHVHDFENGDY